ncbi:MAG: hypothetical protein NC187_06130 [Candidatus Amulumruptor caecigallinarius]|nr:hypothetical protein [Candidatus Amulumruptor caecigallinarius]MCM1397048.1 hypothetical protein [Candidatus Amulumruptor caecigallinarius]MCM1453996.1 hypothetical protein [bacterium]
MDCILPTIKTLTALDKNPRPIRPNPRHGEGNQAIRDAPFRPIPASLTLDWIRMSGIAGRRVATLLA